MDEGTSLAKAMGEASKEKEPVSGEQTSLPSSFVAEAKRRDAAGPRLQERSIKFEEKERVVMHDPNQSIRPFELQKDVLDDEAGSGDADGDGEAKRPFLDEDDFTDDEVDYYYDEGKDTGRTYEQYGSHYSFLTQMTTRVNKNITNWQWYLRNKRTGGKIILLEPSNRLTNVRLIKGNVDHFEPGRLLDRDSPFHQSTGRMQISHIANGDARTQVSSTSDYALLFIEALR